MYMGFIPYFKTIWRPSSWAPEPFPCFVIIKVTSVPAGAVSIAFLSSTESTALLREYALDTPPSIRWSTHIKRYSVWSDWLYKIVQVWVVKNDRAIVSLLLLTTSPSLFFKEMIPWVGVWAIVAIVKKAITKIKSVELAFICEWLLSNITNYWLLPFCSLLRIT